MSRKVTSTIQTATQHAKTVDEQKGYTKVAGDVCEHLHRSICFSVDTFYVVSIIPAL
jgi:hypothetical protein